MRRPEARRFLRPVVRSAAARKRVLRRDQFSCQVCGSVAGDISEINPHARVSLTVGYRSQPPAGRIRLDDLRAECSDCNEGLRTLAFPESDRIGLLTQIRRATVDDQRAVLKWLKSKFEETGR